MKIVSRRIGKHNLLMVLFHMLPEILLKHLVNQISDKKWRKNIHITLQYNEMGCDLVPDHTKNNLLIESGSTRLNKKKMADAKKDWL
jgi:hypothetical protein